MELAHFGHACLLAQIVNTRILIDPGTLSVGFEILHELDAVVITHQHADHLDMSRLPALLTADPDARLFVDTGSAESVRAANLTATVLEPGDRHRFAGMTLDIIGGRHATVHADIPTVENCALVVDDGALYHPGDSFVGPDQDIDVFAVPTSGPWLKVGEAIDFLRSVGPRVAVPIHEAALANTASHFGMLTGFAPAVT